MFSFLGSQVYHEFLFYFSVDVLLNKNNSRKLDAAFRLFVYVPQGRHHVYMGQVLENLLFNPDKLKASRN